MKVDINTLAPIAVVAFNRPDALKSSLASLAQNPLSENSDLFIFIDGPRENHSNEKQKVLQVKSIAEATTGFKSITVKASEQNKGLAKSIIGAATELLDQYGKVIVVEDDLYLSPSFLTFMNTMLEAYRNDSRIMQVTGYSAKIRHPERFHCDYYLTRRAHSWSWGTWKDRWETVDWEVKDFEELAASKEKQKAFCEYGSDLYGMLKGWHDGRNNSWYIRFDYAMHKQGRYCIAPIRSLVRNDGFGPDATHTLSYNRYKIDFDVDTKIDWQIPANLTFNKKLAKHAIRYWSIPYRIYGKIMSKIKK